MDFLSLGEVDLLISSIWLIPQDCSASIPHAFWVGRDVPFTCHTFPPGSFVRSEIGQTGPRVRVVFLLIILYLKYRRTVYQAIRLIPVDISLQQEIDKF